MRRIDSYDVGEAGHIAIVAATGADSAEAFCLSPCSRFQELPEPAGTEWEGATLTTRSNILKVAVGGGIGLLLVLAIVDILAGVKASRFVNAERLEREVRAQLPPGSSLPSVEEFLNQRGIPFSYNGSSGTLTGMVRKVKGSTFLVTKSLQLRFQFDDASILKSIDSKALYTGP